MELAQQFSQWAGTQWVLDALGLGSVQEGPLQATEQRQSPRADRSRSLSFSGEGRSEFP